MLLPTVTYVLDQFNNYKQIDVDEGCPVSEAHQIIYFVLYKKPIFAWKTSVQYPGQQRHQYQMEAYSKCAWASSILNNSELEPISAWALRCKREIWKKNYHFRISQNDLKSTIRYDKTCFFVSKYIPYLQKAGFVIMYYKHLNAL